MAPQRGTKRLALLRVKYSDYPLEPHNDAFYTDLFIARGTGGVNDYYFEQSHGNVNFGDSILFPWATVPFTKAQYWARYPGRNDRILGACRAHNVDPKKYFSVVAIFNDDSGNSSSAADGILVSGNDGPQMSVTWLGHELGHQFGFMDSYDESDRVGAGDGTTKGYYWDKYDIMSAMNVFNFAHPRWTLAGPSLNCASKDFCGWLAPSQIYTTMAEAELPEAFKNTTDVRVYAVGGDFATGGKYYCIKFGFWYIEFRTPDRWDKGLARPCVLIHRMTPQINAVAHTYSHINGIWNNEWPAGSKIGTTDALMKRWGGQRVEIGSFNIEPGNSYARIKIITWGPPLRRRLPPGKERVEGMVNIDPTKALAGASTKTLLSRNDGDLDPASQQDISELLEQEDETADGVDEAESWPELPVTLDSMSAEDSNYEMPPPAKNLG